LNSMPPGAFGLSKSGTAKSSWLDDDSDSEHVVVNAAPSQAQALLSSLDSRVQKRLQTLPSPAHVHVLLLAGQRCLPAQTNVVSFLSSINSMWPAQKNKVLSAVVVSTGGRLVHELYETHVSWLSVGSDDTPTSLIGMVVQALCLPSADLFYRRCTPVLVAGNSVPRRFIHTYLTHHG
jgi:ubiquitin-protein ligase E3 C